MTNGGKCAIIRHMKTIFLLRHAKSAWDNPLLADVDRPLAERGQRDAPRVARALSAAKWMPDAIIASPALRAQQTALLVADAIGFDAPVQLDDRLYPGDAPAFFAVLRGLPPTITRPLLVGHNPAMEAIAAALGQSAAANFKIPTAGLLRFDVHRSDWGRLVPGDGTLRWFLIPKMIKLLGKL